MKQFSKYLATLAVLLATSTAVFAQPHATPLERARQIGALTASGLHDPAPAIPVSDIVIYQRDARLR